MPTIYHIRRAVNHHIKCSSLIEAQVFTPGHVSSGKRCKCWSARSAAFPKEKSGRIANGFGTCFTICCFSPPRQGGEVPVTTLAYLGTYKCCSESAAVFTFLLQHTDGKSLQPRSTENMNCDGAAPPPCPYWILTWDFHSDLRQLAHVSAGVISVMPISADRRLSEKNPSIPEVLSKSNAPSWHCTKDWRYSLGKRALTQEEII